MLTRLKTIYFCLSTDTLNLLEKYGIMNCKPVTTPLPARIPLDEASPFLQNVTSYRVLVGSLQYLTFTRPDLGFAVNFVWQFMYSPTEFHMSLAKRILRYIKATADQGILISALSSLDLTAYADADSAGCLSSRRSTSSFAYSLVQIIYLGVLKSKLQSPSLAQRRRRNIDQCQLLLQS